MNRLGVLSAAALLASGLAAPAIARERIAFISYIAPGDLLFSIIVKGAQDAADLLDADVDFQWGDSDPVKINNLIETAITSGYDGIAVVLPEPDAYDESVCNAVKAGIPVIAFNIDDPEGGNGNCRFSFVGQDFEPAGYALGKRLVEEAGLKSGDRVFLSVEFAEASYATLRRQGVDRALAEVGATSDMIGLGLDPSGVLDGQVQYLLGHSDIAAAVTLGSVTGRTIVQALDEVGLSKVPVAVFDMSTEIMDGIKSGRIIAAADQQPYEQGFYPVVQIVNYSRYGLYPATISTGGKGLTDRASVEGIDIDSLLGVYR
ncbi:substrate-binding domain-containing protein [Mesorhizobium sp. KR9-304]|uniref:substrate-binding domain-containing protein n=1 Tax=Mesorhizobium sp. KR9-304 TaxID=3156614 RepID=UPI0032B447DD